MTTDHEEQFDIAIIGAGASGLIGFYHLVQKLKSKKKIIIFDDVEMSEWGNGIAYAHKSDALLLNVVADKMGIDGENSEGFLLWLKQNTPLVLHSKYYPFVPRYCFSEYLRFEINKIWDPNYHYHFHQKIRNAHFREDHWILKTDKEVEFKTKNLIDASGYNKERYSLPHTIRSNDLNSIENISNDKEVVLLGSGLSAIDSLSVLKLKKHRGKISILSRHGLLPKAHVLGVKRLEIQSFVGLSPLKIFVLLKCFHQTCISENDSAGMYLALRDQAQNIWMHWSGKEKKQFIRHLERYWKILRHRAPPQILIELEKDFMLKKVLFIKGRMTSIEENNHKLKVNFYSSQTNEFESILCDQVIEAFGYSISLFPIIEFSLDSNAENFLFKIGPKNQDLLGESSAIHEIRAQAHEIALRFMKIFN